MEMLDVCQVNTSFMQMAINRTLDFTKSVSNVALQAKKETVSLRNAVHWAVNCVKSSIHDELVVIAEPIPVQICDSLVTDKHWYDS